MVIDVHSHAWQYPEHFTDHPEALIRALILASDRFSSYILFHLPTPTSSPKESLL